MSEMYEESLTRKQKEAVKNGLCPLCGTELLLHRISGGEGVFCTNADDEDEFGESMGTATCTFWTSREWIKYQLGSDSFPPPFQIQVPKKRI